VINSHEIIQIPRATVKISLLHYIFVCQIPSLTKLLGTSIGGMSKVCLTKLLQKSCNLSATSAELSEGAPTHTKQITADTTRKDHQPASVFMLTESNNHPSQMHFSCQISPLIATWSQQFQESQAHTHFATAQVLSTHSLGANSNHMSTAADCVQPPNLWRT